MLQPLGWDSSGGPTKYVYCTKSMTCAEVSGNLPL